MAMGVRNTRRPGARGRGRYTPLSEINVTPMVDVMLVLLIVFMVAAPLMTSGITVDLPKANAAPVPQDSEPLTVSVDSQGKVYLGDAEVELPDLVTRLRAIAADKPDRRIFVKGDRVLNWGRIMEVVSNIAQGGFTKVALLAEQTGGAPRAPAGSPASPPALSAPTVTAPVNLGPTRSTPAAGSPTARPGRG